MEQAPRQRTKPGRPGAPLVVDKCHDRGIVATHQDRVTRYLCPEVPEGVVDRQQFQGIDVIEPVFRTPHPRDLAGVEGRPPTRIRTHR